MPKKKGKRRAKQARQTGPQLSADTSAANLPQPPADASASASQKFTPEQLMAKAEELALACQPEAALSFYQRVLQLDATRTDPTRANQAPHRALPRT